MYQGQGYDAYNGQGADNIPLTGYVDSGEYLYLVSGAVGYHCCAYCEHVWKYFI